MVTCQENSQPSLSSPEPICDVLGCFPRHLRSPLYTPPPPLRVLSAVKEPPLAVCSSAPRLTLHIPTNSCLPSLLPGQTACPSASRFTISNPGVDQPPSGDNGMRALIPPLPKHSACTFYRGLNNDSPHEQASHKPSIAVTPSSEPHPQVKTACWKLCKARITKSVLFDLHTSFHRPRYYDFGFAKGQTRTSGVPQMPGKFSRKQILHTLKALMMVSSFFYLFGKEGGNSICARVLDSGFQAKPKV